MMMIRIMGRRDRYNVSLELSLNLASANCCGLLYLSLGIAALLCSMTQPAKRSTTARRDIDQEL